MGRHEGKPIRALRRTVAAGRAYLPPGLRSLLGIVLLVAGAFGFLPILGFWMIPIGLGLIGLDVPPLRRRLGRWLERHRSARAKRARARPK